MLFWNHWNQESAGRVYFNISREKPAHTPDTPHVQPLSCKLEWTNQKHFYCFLLKRIRDNLAPGFPRALDLSPLHAQKNSGSRLRGVLLTRVNLNTCGGANWIWIRLRVNVENFEPGKKKLRVKTIRIRAEGAWMNPFPQHNLAVLLG